MATIWPSVSCRYFFFKFSPFLSLSSRSLSCCLCMASSFSKYYFFCSKNGFGFNSSSFFFDCFFTVFRLLLFGFNSCFMPSFTFGKLNSLCNVCCCCCCYCSCFKMMFLSLDTVDPRAQRLLRKFFYRIHLLFSLLLELK